MTTQSFCRKCPSCRRPAASSLCSATHGLDLGIFRRSEKNGRRRKQERTKKAKQEAEKEAKKLKPDHAKKAQLEKRKRAPRDAMEVPKDVLAWLEEHRGLAEKIVRAINGACLGDLIRRLANQEEPPVNAMAEALELPPVPLVTKDEVFNVILQQRRWSTMLSPGERQRVAFAHLLLLKPKLVVLDETTSYQSEATQRELYANLQDTGCGILTIGNRPELVQLHSHVIDVGEPLCKPVAAAAYLKELESRPPPAVLDLEEPITSVFERVEEAASKQGAAAAARKAVKKAKAVNAKPRTGSSVTSVSECFIF
eukprot:gnl/TRDRNA2_/TRDRNA2_169792_c0_seq1.p2 gnl/TRDRNA2_/TRDRNA2_169792_c0~~gnl/TRDRNA2_/TRDRNA2_169792_c0_seq1.p2  ORF type:complete len:311 (-),score=74.96 gnl/TRDRNA2_/TRDRNA2_169792_c0_seq1:201-1133(-)